MPKLTVAEAADYLGVTREAIYNRIRRKTLQCTTENGLKYVLIGELESPQTQPDKPKKKQMIDGEFVEYLLKQVDELKDRNEKLEVDNIRLRDEKIQILTKAKDEIKNLYKERDDRLKYLLTLLTRPLLANQNQQALPIDVSSSDLTPYEKEIVSKVKIGKWRNLNNYMREKGYSSKKRTYLQTELRKKLGENKFIREQNGNLYIRSTKTIKEILKEKE